MTEITQQKEKMNEMKQKPATLLTKMKKMKVEWVDGCVCDQLAITNPLINPLRLLYNV